MIGGGLISITPAFLRVPISFSFPFCFSYPNFGWEAGKMDPKNENKKYRTTPEYAEYQRYNFWLDNEGKVPVFNTCVSLKRPSTPPYYL